MTSSATNAQKTPLARTLEQFAGRKVRSAIELLGNNLPCSVAKVVGSGIVTVNFELTNVPFTLPQITVPVLAFEYIRYPIQVGCKGGVISFDAYMGGVSGLGGGTADLSPRPNLSNLMFVPSGNAGWDPADDPNAVVIYGPDGVILRDSQSRIKLQLKATIAQLDLPTGIPLVINGNVVINGGLGLSGRITAADGTSTYASAIETSADVVTGVGTGNQVGVQNLRVSGVATGSGESGPPVPGT